MPRPAPHRLDPATYPHREAIQTRFQDLDVLGHINNVAMAGLFESGRVRFNRAMNLTGWSGHRWLVAKLEINYLGEGFFPDDVEIASGIGEIGKRSWSILAAAFQKGECIATADVVLVMSASGGLTELPPEFRAGLEAHRIRA
ncbi:MULTISPECIES: acyl-CoA thioesterase [Sphingomonas]|jgi:acyl-CoA thioester hydrolase|uniref:acyl-CoA thioesterase n=1 Tax=Sphingomonas TaxID=13687 RepID=UPI001AE4F60E